MAETSPALEEQKGLIKTFDSKELFQGSKEIVIKHHEIHYRLLITKAGKLILNK